MTNLRIETEAITEALAGNLKITIGAIFPYIRLNGAAAVWHDCGGRMPCLISPRQQVAA